MPRNQFQRMFFAFVTVLITVHAYVFYSLYVINGNSLMVWTGANSVLEAIRTQGGVMMCGSFVPIWTIVLVEFCLAMSFIAAFLYYPYADGFHIATLLANWLKLVCFNFPFAFFTQLFFIQPVVRTVFKFVFRKDIEARKKMEEKYA